jgi:hypothetical protein
MKREPNKSATGKGGITVLFHAGRAWPALPERYRWARPESVVYDR